MACCSALAHLSDAQHVVLAADLARVGDPGAESLSAIASRLGVAKSSLFRHKAKCVPGPGASVPGSVPSVPDPGGVDGGTAGTTDGTPELLARATPPSEPAKVSQDPIQAADEGRVALVSDLIRFAKWNGDGTVQALVERWKVPSAEVLRLHRIAASRVSSGRGGKLAQRELSVARCEKIYADEIAYAEKCDNAAIESVAEGEFKQGRAYRSLASSARSTALAAQKQIDQWHASKQAVSVQVNIQTQPDFAAAWALVRRMLDVGAPGVSEWAERGLGVYEDGGEPAFAEWLAEQAADAAALVVSGEAVG